MKDKVKVSSSEEMNIRKTTIVFSLIVIALTYLWSIAYAVSTIVEGGFESILFVVQVFILLFDICTLGLSIATVYYDGIRMKTSLKETIVNFSATVVATTIMLIFIVWQIPALLNSTRNVGIGGVEQMFMILSALLWIVSYNIVLLKNTHTSIYQQTSKANCICLAISLGLLIIPILYGFGYLWLPDKWKSAFNWSLHPMEMALFKLICMVLIFKVIIVSINGMQKQIVIWSILLGFSLMFAISANRFDQEDWWWISDNQGALTLIISSLYMMCVPIVALCLDKKERKAIR